MVVLNIGSINGGGLYKEFLQTVYVNTDNPNKRPYSIKTRVDLAAISQVNGREVGTQVGRWMSH